MKAFGLAMNGMEDRLEAISKDVTERFDEITYVEIGVGEGGTLTAIAQILQESGKKWRAIGVELPNGYSFSKDRTVHFANQRNLALNFITPSASTVNPAWNEVSVYFKDSQTFLTELWQTPIHFALIDGCHGRPCVMMDFIVLEAWVVDGAVIMFHDVSVDQIGEYQPHCSGGIDVRGACYELGLLTNRRQGWKFVEEIPAKREWGGWDMAIFKKESGNGRLSPTDCGSSH
jgi:hypothetical protein